MTSISTTRFPLVLIVNDEMSTHSSLRAAVEPIARVIEATDGEQALVIMHEQTGAMIDLVLLDDVLPWCSGLELLREVRRLRPLIPVVMITAFGSEELAVEALRAGASDYLKRPVALDALKRTVAHLVQTRGTDSAASAGHPNIRKALAFIGDHFAEDITLKDVAREAGLSKYHFCRLFHRETGVTLIKYLHAFRVGRAKALLADRYLQVTQVAYAVGFGDLSHFNRTFRRIVGRSPSEYRASLRTTSALFAAAEQF
jgi:YesN/AraC family two-component response regulator